MSAADAPGDAPGDTPGDALGDALGDAHIDHSTHSTRCARHG